MSISYDSLCCDLGLDGIGGGVSTPLGSLPVALCLGVPIGEFSNDGGTGGGGPTGGGMDIGLFGVSGVFRGGECDLGGVDGGAMS